jgi:YHS domain-containing protein
MINHATILYVGFMLLSFFTEGQTSEIFTTREGAIQGYDVVAYFAENKPVKGAKEFSASYLGEIWFFASAENLKAFQSTPEKYIPQFGGFCAYGMSQGYKAKTEPDAFTIVDGKLYLNYNQAVRKIWNEKQAELIDKANSNWPTVKDAKFK